MTENPVRIRVRHVTDFFIIRLYAENHARTRCGVATHRQGVSISHFRFSALFFQMGESKMGVKHER